MSMAAAREHARRGEGVMVNDKRVGRYVTAFPRFSIGLSSQNSLYGAAGSKFPHAGIRGIMKIQS